MYPIHPLTVHLPIGLLLGNAILTALYLRRRSPALELSAFYCLWVGWIGALPAILAGAIDAARQLFGTPAPRDDALGWINAHALVGLLLVGVYWQTWQMRRRRPAILDDPQARRGYLARILLGLALVILDGWLGGHLVYSLRLGVGS